MTFVCCCRLLNAGLRIRFVQLLQEANRIATVRARIVRQHARVHNLPMMEVRSRRPLVCDAACRSCRCGCCLWLARAVAVSFLTAIVFGRSLAGQPVRQPGLHDLLQVFQVL